MTRFLQVFAAFAFVPASLFAQVSPAEPAKGPRVIVRATVTVEIDGQSRVVSYERTSEGEKVVREVGDQAAVLRALFEPGNRLQPSPPAQTKNSGARDGDGTAMWVAMVRGQEVRALPVPFKAEHPFPEFRAIEIEPAKAPFQSAPSAVVTRWFRGPGESEAQSIRLPLPEGQFMVVGRAEARGPVPARSDRAEADLAARVASLEARLKALELRLTKAASEGL